MSELKKYQLNLAEIEKSGQSKATREGYGDALPALGDKFPKIVALDADLAGSTQSAKFGKKFPTRFFNMGIAESNMAGVSAGLAAAGYIPFFSTFAVFAVERAFEAIRQSIAYPCQNVKICASHGGVTVGEDGGSHQSIEDISLMRSLPNMSVFVPADYTEVCMGLNTFAERKGPMYMRMGRAKFPVLFGEDYPFEYGKWTELTEGRDIAIIACGVETYQTLKAAEELKSQGVSARVINASWVKPIDAKMLEDCSLNCKAILTCEEHSIIGGLGSAVAEFLAERGGPKLMRVGMKDRFGSSGDAYELLDKFELSAPFIAKAARELLERS